jgi:hypothetical protein
MSMVVTGRFEGLIQAEEAMSESLLRFPREDVTLVPPQAAQGSSLVIIRISHHAERRLAVRTLQGRGASDIAVRAEPTPMRRARRGTGRTAALV